MRQPGAAMLLVALPLCASAATVTVDLSREVGRVPDGIYGAGYNGWGDITDPVAIELLQGLALKFIRVEVNLQHVCGEEPGEYDLQYTTPRDGDVGLIDRLRLIRKHGWEPVPVLAISHSLPPWFHGEPRDGGRKAWFRYDTDGTYHEEGYGDQLEAWTRVAQDIAAGLKGAGLSGLTWETIYELGHTMPLADIHYFGAKGVKAADPTARLMGPATWPGWTVEERFVKPYLKKYGPELLDLVSVHWYGNNEHGLWDTGYDPGKGTVTMADEEWLRYLMEVPPKFGRWCRSLRALLDDPELNPSEKQIGVAVTEMDANAYSPYMKTPENPRHPEYDPAADCYINTNVFGGVWNASALCHLMRSGCCDIAMKFNTRQYYGIIDHRDAEGAGYHYMRAPVWFALRMLSHVAGLREGAPLLHTEVEGTLDQAKEHVGGEDSPWVECYATKSERGAALVLINRGLEDERAIISLTGVEDGSYEVARYLFDAERNQRWIGRAPGAKRDGKFEPDEKARCLEPADMRGAEAEGGVLRLRLICPGISMTVVRIAAR